MLRAIRSQSRTAILPVVILTSSADDRDLAEAYRLGANSYVVKPIEFDAFTQVIAEAGSYWVYVNRIPGR
ncbi:MAG TPA: response regulator [Thermoanaerobaculia bacterium]|nr:response regulator [Thermoanaerobaculia bacterium]